MSTRFLPGESHGQRNLAGYSPWGHRVGHDRVPTYKVITLKYNIKACPTRNRRRITQDLGFALSPFKPDDIEFCKLTKCYLSIISQI